MDGVGGVGREARMGRDGEKMRGGGLKVSQSSVVGEAANTITMEIMLKC